MKILNVELDDLSSLPFFSSYIIAVEDEQYVVNIKRTDGYEDVQVIVTEEMQFKDIVKPYVMSIVEVNMKTIDYFDGINKGLLKYLESL